MGDDLYLSRPGVLAAYLGVVAPEENRPAGLSGAIERKLRSELSLECATLDVSREDQTQPIPHLLAGSLGIPAVEIGSVGGFAV